MKRIIVILPLVFGACSQFFSKADVDVIGGTFPPSSQNDPRNLATVALTNPLALAAGATADRSFCTGTLIGPRLVLTAAHCVEEEEPGSYGVALAGSSGEPDASTYIEVKAQKVHVGFGGETVNNDIALLYLKTNARPSAMIASLPTKGLMRGESAWLVGFGNNNGERATGNGLLRQGNVIVREVTKSPSPRFDSRGNRGEQSCNGDSGGPTYRQTADGQYEVIGITSYGEDEVCAVGSWATDVFAFDSWIRESARSFGTDVVIGGAAADQPAESPIVCPQGWVRERFGEGIQCAKGDDVMGPFSTAMVKDCQEKWGGGDACYNTVWHRSIVSDLRGNGFCPRGTQANMKGYCVENGFAFGPFANEITTRCTELATVSVDCKAPVLQEDYLGFVIWTLEH